MTHQQAIAKYGLDICLKAYRLSQEGEGGRTIGIYTGLKTNQADRAIDAGRWFVTERADDSDASDAGLVPFNHNLVR